MSVVPAPASILRAGYGQQLYIGKRKGGKRRNRKDVKGKRRSGGGSVQGGQLMRKRVNAYQSTTLQTTSFKILGEDR